MKIRFLKTVVSVVEKPRLQETWDKTFNRWDELRIEEMFVTGKTATLKTYDGDYVVLVPTDAFERLREEKSPKI